MLTAPETGSLPSLIPVTDTYLVEVCLNASFLDTSYTLLNYDENMPLLFGGSLFSALKVFRSFVDILLELNEPLLERLIFVLGIEKPLYEPTISVI